MSERDERTEEPTAKRLADARNQGQVFRSQEVLSVGMLLIGISIIAFGASWAVSRLADVMAGILLESGTKSLTTSSVQALAMEYGLRVVGILLPLMLTLMVAGILFNVVQSGWNFTFKTIEPQTRKISPIQGFKRIFGTQGLFQFFKSLLKIIIVGPVAYFHIRGLMREIVVLHMQPLESVFSTAGQWILLLFYKVIVILVFLSVLDFVYERWRFKQNMKMTKQEIKDERKQTEGDPKIKKERFKMALRLARRPRLDHAVLKADVVVTNPTHYAVALQYDAKVAPAPRVLVKGIRKRALRIRQLALENKTPIVENPPLARALYGSVSESQEIPEELYPAVATILAAIYRKKGAMPRALNQ